MSKPQKILYSWLSVPKSFHKFDNVLAKNKFAQFFWDTMYCKFLTEEDCGSGEVLMDRWTISSVQLWAVYCISLLCAFLLVYFFISARDLSSTSTFFFFFSCSDDCSSILHRPSTLCRDIALYVDRRSFFLLSISISSSPSLTVFIYKHPAALSQSVPGFRHSIDRLVVRCRLVSGCQPSSTGHSRFSAHESGTICRLMWRLLSRCRAVPRILS